MKDAIIINDLSAFGNCSLNVNLAVLQSMNIQTHAIASFLLSHQSDFEDFYIANVSNHLNEILKRFKNKSIFDGFLSGYLKSEENLLSVNDFLQDFKGLKVIDPVLGDNGKFYKEFSQKQVDLYKEIIKNADVITPNITEACFLADVDYYDFYKTLTKDNIDEKLFSLSKKISGKNNLSIYITGIKIDKKIYNSVYKEETLTSFFTKDNGYHFSGTGDIFASIITGKLLNGFSNKQALIFATKFIKKAVEYSTKSNQTGNYGLLYQKFLKTL